QVPSEIMDRRHFSPFVMTSAPSSFFSDRIGLSTEEQVAYYSGVWALSGPHELAVFIEFRSVRLSPRDALFVRSIDTINSDFEEEIEARTVGNFLPDEDELLSGVTDGIKYNFQSNNGVDVEDVLFFGGGGMELGADDSLVNKGFDTANGVSICHHETLNNIYSGEHPYAERPSRTLFVRNINSEVNDYELKALFEKYGEVHTLYTACKHRGFVTISYYDIRSACHAMKTLQNKRLGHRTLDIHFSIPKDNPSEKDINEGTLVVSDLDASVSNDDLLQIFGFYGDIKEICGSPHGHHQKFIEFYDIRAAEAARYALKYSGTAGTQIKLETSRPGGKGRMMQEFSLDLEQEEANGCCQSPSNNSSLGEYGSTSLGGSTSYGYDNGCLQSAHSTVHAQCHPLVNSKFGGIPSSIPHSLSSAFMLTSVGDQSTKPKLMERSHSMRERHSGFEYMPRYTRSLSGYHNAVANSVLLNSPSTVSSMTMGINSTPVQAVDDRKIYGAGLCQPDSPGYDRHGEHGHVQSSDALGGLGTSGNGSCPHHGRQYAWSNSDSQYHHPQGQVMWPDSPLSSNIFASSTQLHGLPRTASHMLNNSPSLHHLHIGSPSVNPSLWDRRHAYAANATEASESHPRSLGNMGFSGCSAMHYSELPSPSIFPHIGGSITDPSISSHIGLPSPQRRCNMLHGRTSMIPVPASCDANDRVRSRRSDASPKPADNKKQYELDVERIIRGEDPRTTLMIKNIPNKYTSKMLLAAIDEHHHGTYDFVYLPIDFKNKCNVGYAFINMIDPQQIIPFFKTFDGKKWEKFNSEKVVSLAYARIQGKAALIAHFQNSSLMNEDKRCRPILFQTDGPNAGDQEPFPVGFNVRSRAGRPRSTSNKENRQRSPSTSTSAEESSTGTDSSSDSAKDSE
ncbi:hypothetical protein Taro_029255, partial [Colocasia esculenta]|nr:hypothetical protein [Colocasia esculenta]